jgi:hypothetical protein
MWIQRGDYVIQVNPRSLQQRFKVVIDARCSLCKGLG